MIFGRFLPQWRHWKACVLLRREAAQERMLAGLLMPAIRDVITVRRYVPRTVSSGVMVSLDFVKFVLDKKLRPRDCRCHDMVRIVERIAWCLGVALNYRITTLSCLLWNTLALALSRLLGWSVSSNTMLRAGSAAGVVELNVLL